MRKEKKHALPLELISAQDIQCQGAGNDIFKPAILFDFASNVLLSSLSLLSVSSSAEIMVENKRQGILPLFQWIEFSMFLGYLESILLEEYASAFPIAFQTLWEKKALFLAPSPSEIFPFHTPLLFGICLLYTSPSPRDA